MNIRLKIKAGGFAKIVKIGDLQKFHPTKFERVLYSPLLSPERKPALNTHGLQHTADVCPTCTDMVTHIHTYIYIYIYIVHTYSSPQEPHIADTAKPQVHTQHSMSTEEYIHMYLLTTHTYVSTHQAFIQKQPLGNTSTYVSM